MTRRIPLFVLGLCLLAHGAAVGATDRYVLQIPAGQTVRYELELEPQHSGAFTILAEWTGNRIVSLKLEPPPGAGITVRRNGPSPQRIEVNVDERSLAKRKAWLLSVRSPSGRDAGEGVLMVVLPEPAPEPRWEPMEESTPIDSWAAWRMPAGVPRSWTHFDDWAHRLRDVLRADERGDTCRWQEPLLDYIDRTRQAMIEDGVVPESATRTMLRIIAAAVDDVDAMRTSDDPFITGPFPEDPQRRRAYLRVRSRQLAPLETALDQVLMRIGRDHAADLGEELWPVRFVSCMTACERHFAEVPVVGTDEAPNAELARDQWDRLVEAARTLFALADVEPAP